MKNILFNEILNRASKEFKNDLNAEKIASLYKQYCNELDELNELSNDNKNTVLKALLRAKMSIKEQEIYALNNELESIRKQIKLKEIQLHEDTKECFNELLKVVQNDIQKEYLEDLMLHEASALKILYETSQNAFISVLESNTMIYERSLLISSYMLINVLEYAKFDKNKILNAANLILQAAIDLANEWQSYADELLEAVINGLLEAIFTILEKLKKDLEVSLNDDELNIIEDALINLESDFVSMIKKSIDNNASGKSLENILKNKLNNGMSKLTRLIRENKQLLSIKFINFQNSELNAKIKKELSNLEKAYNEFDAKKLAANLINKFKKNQQ